MLTGDIPPHHRDAKKWKGEAGASPICNLKGGPAPHKLGQLVLKKQGSAWKVDADVKARHPFLNQIRKNGGPNRRGGRGADKIFCECISE
jgi:hypothetical protein